VEHFAKEGIDFAGVIVIAPFSDLPTLLTRYSIGGLVPLLHPIEWIKGVHRRFPSVVVDKWYSAARLANFVQLSKQVRLFIIHARNDYEIPCGHSDNIFAAVANATSQGMDKELFLQMKERNTIDVGDGASISTWKVSPKKIVQEIIVAYGGEFVLDLRARVLVNYEPDVCRPQQNHDICACCSGCTESIWH
jgi:hypothetical protein